MNPIEFASKTLFVYSLRRGNERLDLSSLPDVVFDKVLSGIIAAKMCEEGNVFTGKFVMDKAKAVSLIGILEREVAPEYPRVKQLIAYLNALQDGDVFRIVSNDAPTMNKQLAVLKTNGEEKGLDERAIHNRYLVQWGALSTGYHHYAFGYDGIRTAIGEGDRTKRVCRFCGGSTPNVKFRDVAHAISEGLGNKLLICNEECDDCNNKLSKLESNLMHYLDVRRALGGVLTKSDGSVPSVDGKGFVIRGDDNNQPILYIEAESIPKNIDITKPFQFKLETDETITHQGIYKTLCKIVIDLLPAGELSHFAETIGWINGSVYDGELPPYWASYGQVCVKQPTVDIFMSRNPGREPYCTAIAHILDAFFVFILPEVDVDRSQYKTEQSIKRHVAKFTKPYEGYWQVEDSSEYELSYPWSSLLVKPGEPKIQIKPKDDPVFMRYRKEGVEKDEKVFPPFTTMGISDAVISNVIFERHSTTLVTIEELHQVSVNFKRFECFLYKDSASARIKLDVNFSDSSNRLSYFDFSFESEVKFTDFDKYIIISDYFCIDYHLRDYLCDIVMTAADIELNKYTAGTDLEPVTLKKILDPRIVRQLYYYVPVGDGRYLVVKDAELHNLGTN